MGEEVARGNAAVNVDLNESETCHPASASSVAFGLFWGILHDAMYPCRLIVVLLVDLWCLDFD